MWLREGGFSLCDIGKRLDRNVSTVLDCWQEWSSSYVTSLEIIDDIIRRHPRPSLAVPVLTNHVQLAWNSIPQTVILHLTQRIPINPRECLNSFKNAVKSSGETYIQFAARLTANFQYYCSLRKVNSFESLCDLIISDKLYETLNKETATHIGIREAEDWFRPIDLAKECDIYISSGSGSHKEIPITYGYTQNPFKNRSQNFKPKIKENYPQYHERENKNCFICGDSSHCARDCEKRFKPKESNDHIHNRINVNTLKVESEKQNSDECTNLQYVNIFVENRPVTALIDSGCQIPVLNSSLIRVQTPSEEIITLSSCFGEQRMVEVKPINISLDQHSPGAHAYAYSSAVSFPNVSVSNVIENSSYDLSHVKNSSYDLSHVKNFNTRNDSSSLIKDYKYSPLVSMEVPLRTAYGQNGRYGMQPKARQSSRAGAAKTRTETVELVEEKQKLLDIRERKRTRERCIFQRTIDKYSACVEVGKPIDENSACVEVGTTHKHLRRGVNSNNFKNYFSSNDITCEEVKSVESTFLLDTSYVRATREPEKKKKKKGRIFSYFYKMYKNALKEDLIRVVEELDGTVESTDTIVKLKTKIENSSTFESDPDFVKTLIQNCIDERVSQNEREVTSEQKIELAKLQLAKLEKKSNFNWLKIKH
ncbi:retrovirus-related Pol polyprotein from transposon 412 [Trichonephila clavipes]|uniref:Retrovirus-related Pol polyprotein from transposon 412 n=1 Tax=Trichonephila clavipes TaxID=2585209 RepID=A0A8X6RS21_TRICX|nr:retrovirus-related Pol polyprotein from transposon 412 [Trichonephila clavipes]